MTFLAGNVLGRMFHPGIDAGRSKTVQIVGKKIQNQDIQARLRELTEQTRRTRRELEEMILRPEGERPPSFSHDSPQFFRRRKPRTQK
jgi:hypothetical protein